MANLKVQITLLLVVFLTQTSISYSGIVWFIKFALS